MAESTLSLTSSQLRSAVGQFLGYGRSYRTSTVTVASGVTTLADTSQSWPADAANWWLVVDNSGWKRYSVDSRDSDTQITLDNTGISVGAGASYVLEPWSDAERDDINAAIDEGLRVFYAANHWDWLYLNTSLTTVAEYTTGTITIASGVVTLSGGTFPSWAASGELTVDSDGVTYEVSTRDSNTQVTLVDTSVTVASASNYTLAQTVYDLPDDFGGIEGTLTYRAGNGALYPPLQHVNDNQLREMKQDFTYTTWPRCYTIRPKAYDNSAGTRWEIEFYPPPDDAYKYYYEYRSFTGNISDEYVYPLGGMSHAQTIEYACLRAAEERHMDDRPSRYRDRYAEALADSLRRDASDTRGQSIGYIGDPSEMPPMPPGLPSRSWGGPVTYEE